jgi:endonuclease YncB( thermonuclease family)
MRARQMIAVLAASLAAAIAGRSAHAEALGPGGLIVGQAVALDGETLDFPAYRVRVWGIDAPQRGSWCFRAGEKWKPAAAAATALSSCLKAKTITCRVQKREWHWLRTRYVAECWSDDGQDLGDCMVAGGWATDYTCYSDGYYGDRETEARNKGIGLWACDNGPPTRRWGRKGRGVPCELPTYKPSGPGPR